MTNYTIEQLQGMKLDEIKRIARDEFKLALSSQGKKFNKGQLITKIVDLVSTHEIYTEVMKPKKTVKHAVIKPMGNFTKVETMAKDSLSILVKAKNKKDLVEAVETVKTVLSHWKQQAALQGRNMYQQRKIEKQVKLLSITAKPYAKKVGLQL